jgi:hypothetical protein
MALPRQEAWGLSPTRGAPRPWGWVPTRTLDQVLRLHLHLRPTLRPEEVLPSPRSLHSVVQEASPMVTNFPVAQEAPLAMMSLPVAHEAPPAGASHLKELYPLGAEGVDPMLGS